MKKILILILSLAAFDGYGQYNVDVDKESKIKKASFIIGSSLVVGRAGLSYFSKGDAPVNNGVKVGNYLTAGGVVCLTYSFSIPSKKRREKIRLENLKNEEKTRQENIDYHLESYD